MKRSSNTAALGLVALVAIAASGCGKSEPISDVPCVREPVIAAKPKLNVDETHNTFTPRQVRIPGGTTLITVTVPTTAKSSHGVAIDGGLYDHVKGAGVKPGRASSLTVAVKPGTYTIYDPVGNNRAKGFKTKLIVGRNAPASKVKPPCVVPNTHLPR